MGRHNTEVLISRLRIAVSGCTWEFQVVKAGTTVVLISCQAHTNPIELPMSLQVRLSSVAGTRAPLLQTVEPPLPHGRFSGH